MNKLHSLVVEKLLERYVRVDKSLYIMDLGCGKGNNLIKIEKYHPKLVHAMDKNPNALDVAASKLKHLSKAFQKRVMFSCVDLTDPHFDLVVNPVDDNSVDLISFQCSIGYLFGGDNSLERVLGWCSKKLKRGGYIVGTNMEGARVKALVATTQGNSMYHHDYYIKIDGNALTVKHLLPNAGGLLLQPIYNRIKEQEEEQEDEEEEEEKDEKGEKDKKYSDKEDKEDKEDKSRYLPRRKIYKTEDELEAEEIAEQQKRDMIEEKRTAKRLAKQEAVMQDLANQEYLMELKTLKSKMAKEGLEEKEIKPYAFWYSELVANTAEKKNDIVDAKTNIYDKPTTIVDKNKSEIINMGAEERQMAFLYVSFAYQKPYH